MDLSRNLIADNGARQLAQALKDNRVKNLPYDVCILMFSFVTDIDKIRAFLQSNQQRSSMSIEKRTL